MYLHKVISQKISERNLDFLASCQSLKKRVGNCIQICNSMVDIFDSMDPEPNQNNGSGILLNIAEPALRKF
jgi:hypothetical protein